MTVQVLLEQLQEFSGILVVDDPEVDLEHRTPRKNSLRAFPDVAGLEPADCTGRLCHVVLECFPVILRPWKTLQSPLPQESIAVELDLVHQPRLDRCEHDHIIVPSFDENLLVWTLDRGHGPDEPPCGILGEWRVGRVKILLRLLTTQLNIEETLYSEFEL